jgi:hypothetical protein
MGGMEDEAERARVVWTTIKDSAYVVKRVIVQGND